MRSLGHWMTHKFLPDEYIQWLFNKYRYCNAQNNPDEIMKKRPKTKWISKMKEDL